VLLTRVHHFPIHALRPESIAARPVGQLVTFTQPDNVHVLTGIAHRPCTARSLTRTSARARRDESRRVERQGHVPRLSLRACLSLRRIVPARLLLPAYNFIDRAVFALRMMGGFALSCSPRNEAGKHS